MRTRYNILQCHMGSNKVLMMWSSSRKSPKPQEVTKLTGKLRNYDTGYEEIGRST